VIVATRELSGVTGSVSTLARQDGTELGDDCLDLRLARRAFTRTWYNRPAEEVVPVARHLLPNAPFDMAQGTSWRVHLIVRVPDDAPPGVYRGELTVSADDAAAQTLPIEFEVLPIELGDPSKHYSLYYRTVWTEETEQVVRAELADIRAHGADRLLWRPIIEYREEGGRVVVDYDGVIAQIELLREYGFAAPHVVWDGFERLASMTDGEEGELFRSTALDALLGLRELAEERGWGEVVVTHMDEVFGRDRLDRYVRLAEAVRQLPEQRIYITFHNQPRPGIAEMIERIDPYVDLRCYHGHSIDMWLGSGHTLQELAAELNASGDEAWCYYNPRSVDVTPEWARLCNGFWLWLTPITTHVPWAYNAPKGDPLEDADGFDFGYAFYVDGEVMPTRLWEGYREGIDDMRYLSTLEALVADHLPERAAQARDAARWLRDLRSELLDLPIEEEQSALVKAMATRYSADDYDRWRRECAEHIARVAEGVH
jgi:hypothetical protein